MDNRREIPLYGKTKLKDQQNKTEKGNLHTLTYLFRFLDAYDFASDGEESIQEENKSLINASVLGLIFEKINGYKDGSFFTPGFITMYMCRETIRKAVVQKFSEAKQQEFTDFEDLKSYCFHYYKKEDKLAFNQLVNSLKICDPAVGSGHFLVSALNELIAVKSELGILVDENGLPLKIDVSVVNDELVITDQEGDLLDYKINQPESFRIQKTLFHEKQSLIENSLFGVDINSNSVKICRLRLWIELLKHAYYKPFSPASAGSNSNIGAEKVLPLGAEGASLETLPNIDINIKTGNSLISRFDLDADLGEALKESKWNMGAYRDAVQTYRNARNKDEKRTMMRLIKDIKSNFRSEINANDPKKLRLEKAKGELFNMTQQTGLFEKTKSQQKAWKKKVDQLSKKTKTLETELQEIKDNKIYENAFEWRFEFPEVLDEKGNFMGFDVVIGNPPYINFRDIKNTHQKDFFLKTYETAEYQSDLFILFIEKAFKILKNKGQFSFIIPNTISNNLKNSKIRKFILNNSRINSIVDTPIGVFPDATVDTIVIETSKLDSKGEIKVYNILNENINYLQIIEQRVFYKNDNFYFDFLTSNETHEILNKISLNSVKLDEICDSSSGLKEYEKGKGKPPQTKEDRENKVFNSKIKIDETFKKHITGSQVDRFVLKWQGDYLKYGPWIAAPRDEKYFQGERIVIREIPSKSSLVCAFTDKEYTIKNTAHIFKVLDGFDTKFVVGILNSKLLGFYFINKFSERDDVFPKAKIGQCRELPIIKCNKEKQQQIEPIVNQILTQKETNPKADTSALEAEIDVLVYQLYGLSYEEVLVVDEGFGMSRDEFESLAV